MAYVIAACTVCVSIFALMLNSDRFQIYGLTRSYSSWLFLCALVDGSGFLTGRPAWDETSTGYSSTRGKTLGNTTHNTVMC